MRLVYIDHGHYKLSAKQAKFLSIENRLPRPGYEMKADPAKLAGLELVMRDRYHEGELVPSARIVTANTKGWILRTPLSYWNGEPVKDGWVWALHLY